MTIKNDTVSPKEKATSTQHNNTTADAVNKVDNIHPQYAPISWIDRSRLFIHSHQRIVAGNEFINSLTRMINATGTEMGIVHGTGTFAPVSVLIRDLNFKVYAAGMEGFVKVKTKAGAWKTGSGHVSPKLRRQVVVNGTIVDTEDVAITATSDPGATQNITFTEFTLSVVGGDIVNILLWSDQDNFSDGTTATINSKNFDLEVTE